MDTRSNVQGLNTAKMIEDLGGEGRGAQSDKFDGMSDFANLPQFGMNESNAIEPARDAIQRALINSPSMSINLLTKILKSLLGTIFTTLPTQARRE